VDGYRFVFSELAQHMKDDAFRRDVALIGVSDDRVHKELVVLRYFDRIGAYIRFGLVDREIVYTSYRYRILICWENLSEVVAIHRHIADPHFWENVEFLVNDCAEWSKERGFDVDIEGATRRVEEALGTPPEAGTRAHGANVT